MKTKDVVIIAIFASLSLVLSMIKVFQMPNGGSISLYLVPLMFIAYKRDFKAALLCCFIASILQLVLSNYILGFIQVMLDYILPVCLVSILALMKNKPLALKSSMIVVTGVLILSCYVLSGMLYFGVNFTGSLTYNATFFVPTYIISIVLVTILDKSIKNI